MSDNIILLVEDNPDDEDLTLRAFKKNKLQADVIVVRDGVEALDYLFATGQYRDRDPNRVPKVILLDLKIPKIDGLAVLRRLRTDERTYLLPVVILSSSKEDYDLQTAYELGANSYLCKPVDFTEFIEGMKQILHYWLVLNQTPRR